MRRQNLRKTDGPLLIFIFLFVHLAMAGGTSSDGGQAPVEKAVQTLEGDPVQGSASDLLPTDEPTAGEDAAVLRASRETVRISVEPEREGENRFLADARPDSCAGHTELVFANGVTFELKDVHFDHEALSVLSAEQKITFCRKRLAMIQPLARVFAIFGVKRSPFFQRRIDEISDEIQKHASVLIESKEFGVNFPFGPMAGAAFMKYGLFHALNLGGAVGVDDESKTLVLEIFLDWHSLNVALPVIAEVAIGTNVMAYAANPRRPLVQKGRYYSPWVLPVASIDFNDSVNIGYSMGVGLPPIDSLYSYSSHVTRLSLLRWRVPWTRAEATASASVGDAGAGEISGGSRGSATDESDVVRLPAVQSAISVLTAKMRAMLKTARVSVKVACARLLGELGKSGG